MTKEELNIIEDLTLNCELLNLAVETLEKLRLAHIPDDLVSGWIKEMKDEAGFQISQHDEMRTYFL